MPMKDLFISPGKVHGFLKFSSLYLLLFLNLLTEKQMEI